MEKSTSCLQSGVSSKVSELLVHFIFEYIVQIEIFLGLSVLMTFVNHFNSKADLLLERLRSLADGKTVVKLFPEINRAALDIIAMVSF